MSLTLFFTIVTYLLRPFETDDNIETVDANIQNFKQGSFTTTNYLQQLETKKLRFCSIYDQKVLKGRFVEGEPRSTCWSA